MHGSTLKPWIIYEKMSATSGFFAIENQDISFTVYLLTVV